MFAEAITTSAQLELAVAQIGVAVLTALAITAGVVIAFAWLTIRSGGKK